MTTPFWAPDAARTLRQADRLLSCAVLSWFEVLCDQRDQAPTSPLDRLIRESLGVGAKGWDGPATAGQPASRGPWAFAAETDWPTEPPPGGRRPAGGTPGEPVQPGLPLLQRQPVQYPAPARARSNGQVNPPQPAAGDVAGTAASAAPGPAAASPARRQPLGLASLPPMTAGHAPAPIAALRRTAPPGQDRYTPDREADPRTLAGRLDRLDRRDRRDRLLDRLGVARPGATPPDRPAAVGTRTDLTAAAPLRPWPPAVPTVASRRASDAQRSDADGAGTVSGRVWSPVGRNADTAIGDGARVQPAASGGDDPPSTRLVTGLPALQGLLSATLADSRQRHAESALPDTWSHGPAGAPHPAPTGTLPALAGVSGAASAAWGDRSLPAAQGLLSGLLPGLDALGEDMLVDHLADRLAERLRDQTLRQHGFTGGWL